MSKKTKGFKSQVYIVEMYELTGCDTPEGFKSLSIHVCAVATGQARPPWGMGGGWLVVVRSDEHGRGKAVLGQCHWCLPSPGNEFSHPLPEVGRCVEATECVGVTHLCPRAVSDGEGHV